VLLEQSRTNFQFVVNSVEYLEKKADDLIRYLGLGTGLVGILLNYPFCNLKSANIKNNMKKTMPIHLSNWVVLKESTKRKSKFLKPLFLEIR